MQTTKDLVTIQEFARQYGVDTETVRSWVKDGYVNYKLVGPRRMVKKSDLVSKSAFLKLINEEDPIV